MQLAQSWLVISPQWMHLYHLYIFQPFMTQGQNVFLVLTGHLLLCPKEYDNMLKSSDQ